MPKRQSSTTMTGRAYVSRLEAQIAAIAALLSGTREEDLERRAPSGAWCAREHLAHLARYHEVFLVRIARMLHEDRPRFLRYRAEDDPEFAPWLTLPAHTVLARLRELRAELTERVAPLGSPALARIGVHPAFGEMPLSLWIEFFLAHEGHHLYVMFQRAREGMAAR